MTATPWLPARPDHDEALHMGGARPQPVRTRRVGHQADHSPRAAITQSLAAIGRDRLPPSLLEAHDGLHLHPGVVAAAVHATSELVATRVGMAAPGTDEGLYERLARGRRALGAPDARWTEMALHRLQWLAQCAAQVTGGTRVHGLVRWVNTASGPEVGRPDEDTTKRLLVLHLVLAYSTPPVSTLRRAPSLEYYRASGVMVLRNFGGFDVDSSEGR